MENNEHSKTYHGVNTGRVNDIMNVSLGSANTHLNVNTGRVDDIMNVPLGTEARLLGYEDEIKQKIENEIEEARKQREKLENQKQIKITDISQLLPEEKFHKNTIYKIYNRKQKTETFINGEQAENLVQYTDDYVIRFDHCLKLDG